MWNKMRCNNWLIQSYSSGYNWLTCAHLRKLLNPCVEEASDMARPVEIGWQVHKLDVYACVQTAAGT